MCGAAGHKTIIQFSWASMHSHKAGYYMQTTSKQKPLFPFVNRSTKSGFKKKRERERIAIELQDLGCFPLLLFTPFFTIPYLYIPLNILYTIYLECGPKVLDFLKVGNYYSTLLKKYFFNHAVLKIRVK